MAGVLREREKICASFRGRKESGMIVGLMITVAALL